MRRILPGRCLRFAVGGSVLPLFLVLVSRDAVDAQQQRQALPDLAISFDEGHWEPRSAVPTRSVRFCVRNVGSSRSGVAVFQLFHRRIGGTTLDQRDIGRLGPNTEQCDRLRIAARPEWRGRTQNFVGHVATEFDANWQNNQRPLSIRFPADRPPVVDLELEIYWQSFDYSREQLLVPFRVTNIGNVSSAETKVGILVPGEGLRGVQNVGPLAPDRSSTGTMTIRVRENWLGSTRDFIAIVDPDQSIGDRNRENNSRPFSYVFRWPSSSGGTPASSGDGSGFMTFIVIAALFALAIWFFGKRKQAPQSASPAVRAKAHPDAGTQSIHLENDDVVPTDLQLRPVPDAGTQWIAFEHADLKG
jgi:hypothetical protein